MCGLVRPEPLAERTPTGQSVRMAQAACPGCLGTVRCSADHVPIVIEFDRLPDGRYLAWAALAPGESASEITVVIESDDGSVTYSTHAFPFQIGISDRRLVAVHECAYGGDAHDRTEAPNAPPRRTGSVEVDPTRPD